MPDAIGWVATAVFTASYFFRRPALLRRVQACAALLWLGYGVAIRSSPVIVANALVAAAAVVSEFTQFRSREASERSAP
jgi:hypothetical protein